MSGTSILRDKICMLSIRTVTSEIGFRFSLTQFYCAQTFYAFSHLHRAPSHRPRVSH